MTRCKDILSIIERDRDTYLDLARRIWERPELSFEEHYAAAEQVKLLESWGFSVTFPYLGLETAFRAEWGEGDIVFALASEYDALPGIGHGCGHNLICTAALASANALRQLMTKERIPGKLVVLGTPAEEGGSGKVLLERQGALDDIHACMMVHPKSSPTYTTDPGCTANQRATIDFYGKASHAGGMPEQGINALDAMNLVYAAVGCWRQQLPEDARIHGVITAGGDRPNIIPDHTQAKFYLRCVRNTYLETMKVRFKNIVDGACLMTDCTSKIDFADTATAARKPNGPMNKLYMKALKDLGIECTVPAKPGGGSTDFGNFSIVRPGIHPYFGICDNEYAGHSVEMTAAANSERGQQACLNAAAAMDAIALEYYTNPDFRAEVDADFRR